MLMGTGPCVWGVGGCGPGCSDHLQEVSLGQPDRKLAQLATSAQAEMAHLRSICSLSRPGMNRTNAGGTTDDKGDGDIFSAVVAVPRSLSVS